MSELLLCAACLNNEIDLIHIDTGQMRDQFNAICGVETQNVTGLSVYLCEMCIAYIKKMMKLRKLCLRSAQAFQKLFNRCKKRKKKASESGLHNLGITPMLSYPQPETFSYTEIEHSVLKNRNTKTLYKPEEKILTVHYEIKDQPQYVDMSSNKESQVIIKENITLNIGSPSINNLQNIKHEEIYDYDYDNINQDDDPNEYETKENYLNQTEEPNVSDALELPRETLNYKDKFDIINYFAKIEPLPDQEARAAYDLTLMVREKENKDSKQNNTYYCKVCNCRVKCKKQKAHMSSHEKDTYFCDICSFRFNFEGQLNKHKALQHSFKYICRICSEVHYTSTDSEIHFIEEHNPKNVDFKVRMAEIAALVKDQTTRRKRTKDDSLNIRFLVKNHFNQVKLSLNEQQEAFEKRKESDSYKYSIYKCDVCYLPFAYEQSFKKHMDMHKTNDLTETDQTSCNICKLHFKATNTLTQHIESYHKYKYQCKICSEDVYIRRQILDHWIAKHTKTIKCNHCDATLPNLISLQEHKMGHYSVYCNQCGGTYERRNHLHKHVTAAHSEEVYTAILTKTYNPDKNSELYCSECNVEFFNGGAFNRHLAHKQHPDYIQPISGVVYEKTINPRRKRFTSMNCHICGEYLAFRKVARAHYIDKHSIKDFEDAMFPETFQCDECEYTTKKPRYFRKHVRQHKIGLYIPCDVCGRLFSSQERVKAHKYVHTDETPFECAHCEKKFKSRKRVLFHIKTVHLKIPHMPWVRRAERRKQMRLLERQNRSQEQYHPIQSTQSETYPNFRNEEVEPMELEIDYDSQIDLNNQLCNEEQEIAAEFLSNFVRSGNVVFSTKSA